MNSETPTEIDDTITPIRPEPLETQQEISEIDKESVPQGHLLIKDMTREQLINAVTNLATVQTKQAEEINRITKILKEVHVIWGDKKQVQKRLSQLKGK